MTKSIPLSVALSAVKAEREKRRRQTMGVEARQYCPHTPWPRQRDFLKLDCVESFYGGAAAGGKSDALLMAALEYVHVPRYAALILRVDSPRLSLSGGLIPRSHEWFVGTDAKWSGRDRRWTFPSGASIQFGYIQTATDRYRYGSSEYQYIAFDELTEFREDDYTFLFSRLRKTVDLDVPLRMRSASNPGGLGHGWVKTRFITDEAAAALQAGQHGIYWKDGAAFVPARIADNPAIDANQYRENLMHLPVVTRERLMAGDWTIQEESLIRETWLRYFDMRGQILLPLTADGEKIGHDVVIDERECTRFNVCDPAGSSQDRAKEAKGKPRSWSVIETWDYWPHTSFLFLRNVWRKRVGFDGLCAGLVEMHNAWKPARTYIENEKLGTAAVDVLRNNIPIETIPTGGRDKVSRAAPLLNKLERGEVFLPKFDNDWRPDLEAEWLGWTGLDEETSDQIDAAAYAAVVGKGHAPTRIDAVVWDGVPGNGRSSLWGMRGG